MVNEEEKERRIQKEINDINDNTSELMKTRDEVKENILKEKEYLEKFASKVLAQKVSLE